MSGAPTATTVFLSLDAAINYSSGSPDTLPANTPAVIYGTSDTAFDRSLDVWVPFTVRGSHVLSIIKESQLASITADYVAMARVELHGIKPYQPEPYLAAGGTGGAAPTATSVLSAAGQAKVYPLGSEPSGWQNTGFNDASWAACIAETDTDTTTAYGAAPGGSAWVTYQDGNVADDQTWLLRHTFSLPVGLPASATLTYLVDDFLLGLWMNGTAVSAPPWAGLHVPPYVVTIPTSLLRPGAPNTLALKVQNGHPSAGPSAVAYVLTLSTAGTGGIGAPASPAEGDLLYYHGGQWVRLPAGTTGQELTIVSGDPAWATPAAGGSLSTASAILGADVTMSSAATWYDGPSISLAAGTWLVVAQMAFSNPGTNNSVACRLYDGTTTYALAGMTQQASWDGTLPLCALVTASSTITLKLQGYSVTVATVIMRAQVSVAVGNKATQINALKVA